MIQYPKNTHITLPSIVGGLGTMNILKDPPRSIQTRFISKVGDTSKITEWIDGSGDRICEGVKVYSRGVNPMVSVDYSNYGSNGGQMRAMGGARGTDQRGISSLGQSYLPYRIMKDGAFRPPITPLEELLPLSRLPRLPTSENTNIGSNITNSLGDLDRQLRCNTKTKDLREIRNELLSISCKPNKTLNIETPFTELPETKNMIHDSCLNVSMNTNPNATKYTLGVNTKPERGIHENMRYASVISKPYKNIQSSIDTQKGNQPVLVQERLKGSCVTNKNGMGNTSYIHKIQDLDRNMPVAQAYTNKVGSGDLNNLINSREFRNLPERVNRGSFSNNGFQQTFDRDMPEVRINNTSNNVYSEAAKQLDGRFGPPLSF